jgi:pyruvate dehydrogenase E2 component (dihydrolipoamide acetyltransferase)
MTYDADSDGVLVEIVAQEGDTLPIGEVIARIGEEGEAKSSGAAEESPGEEDTSAEGDEDASDDEVAEAEPAKAEGEDETAGEADDEAAAEDEQEADAGGDEEEAAVAGAEGGGGETQAAAGTATREKSSEGNGDGRVKASPVARRMARDLGVELAQLEGTGPGGRIVKADVQAAAENGGGATTETAEEPEGATEEKPKKKDKAKKKDKEEKKEPAQEAKRGEAGAKGEAEIQELTRLQQTVSRRMAESKATAPDFSISLTVDMTAAVELRERLKQISDPVPSFNDMVVKASASALREFPRVNGAYRDGKFELYENVNIGIAVAAQDALVVPTLFDADQKSLGQIARDARQVIGKVKEKTVTPPELSGGTFTVSNLGMFGIEQFTAIINPPQAAILTVGKLEKKPAVDDKGKIVARDQMVLTLVCDHRILYGADGAQFLARVKELLEQPLSLAL